MNEVGPAAGDSTSACVRILKPLLHGYIGTARREGHPYLESSPTLPTDRPLITLVSSGLCVQDKGEGDRTAKKKEFIEGMVTKPEMPVL